MLKKSDNIIPNIMNSVPVMYILYMPPVLHRVWEFFKPCKDQHFLLFCLKHFCCEYCIIYICWPCVGAPLIL